MGVLWSMMERVLSKDIQRNQLKPGDHIYTRRPDDSKSDRIFVCKDYVIHQADKGYRMLRTRIDNFLGPHLEENNGEDSAVYFKTGRVSRSEQAVSLLAVACAVFFLLRVGIVFSDTPLSLFEQLLWVLSAWQIYLASVIELRTPKEVEEFSPLATLKKWIILTYSVLFYTAFGIPEWITLFCWSIFQRNWLLFKKISVEQLNRGDHIYTWRDYAYTHHGIYAGDKKVIHVERGAGPIICSSASSSSSPSCSSNIYVESIDIDKFLSGGELYVYDYGVNVSYFIAKFRGGACTLASSDRAKDVLDRANYLLLHESWEGKKLKKDEKRSEIKVIVGAYDLLRNNCEDFAIYCKTGLAVRELVAVGSSGQAASLAAIGFAFTFNISDTKIIRVAASLCVYSAFRIISNTKYRWDASRIRVERLADFEIVKGLTYKRSVAFRIILCLIILWSFWCAEFCAFGMCWRLSTTECRTLKQLNWIIWWFFLWLFCFVL